MSNMMLIDLSDGEWESFKTEIVQGIGDFWKKIGTWSTIVARLSNYRMQTLKKLLRPYGCTGDQIERMRLYGRGLMHEQWLLPNKGLRASVFRNLPEAAQHTLNDLDAHVEVLTPTGVVVKQVSELNSIEVQQIVEPGEGILNADMQQKRMLRPAPKQRRVDQQAGTAYIFDGLSRTTEGEVLVYGRDVEDEPGARRIAIKFTRREFRRLFTKKAE